MSVVSRSCRQNYDKGGTLVLWCTRGGKEVYQNPTKTSVHRLADQYKVDLPACSHLDFH